MRQAREEPGGRPAAGNDERGPAAVRKVGAQPCRKIEGERRGHGVRRFEAAFMPHAAGSAQLRPSRAISATDGEGPQEPAV